MCKARPVRRLVRLYARGRRFPFATGLSLISVPIGLLAIFIGQEVSRAFTIVWNRPEPVYVWGVVLLLGGAHVAAGIMGQNTARERAGLWILAVAYAFYGASVILGLGWGGMVTGPTFLVLALCCIQRALMVNEVSYDATGS